MLQGWPHRRAVWRRTAAVHIARRQDSLDAPISATANLKHLRTAKALWQQAGRTWTAFPSGHTVNGARSGSGLAIIFFRSRLCAQHHSLLRRWNRRHKPLIRGSPLRGTGTPAWLPNSSATRRAMSQDRCPGLQGSQRPLEHDGQRVRQGRGCLWQAGQAGRAGSKQTQLGCGLNRAGRVSARCCGAVSASCGASRRLRLGRRRRTLRVQWAGAGRLRARQLGGLQARRPPWAQALPARPPARCAAIAASRSGTRRSGTCTRLARRWAQEVRVAWTGAGEELCVWWPPLGGACARSGAGEEACVLGQREVYCWGSRGVLVGTREGCIPGQGTACRTALLWSRGGVQEPPRCRVLSWRVSQGLMRLTLAEAFQARLGVGQQRPAVYLGRLARVGVPVRLKWCPDAGTPLIGKLAGSQPPALCFNHHSRPMTGHPTSDSSRPTQLPLLAPAVLQGSRWSSW